MPESAPTPRLGDDHPWPGLESYNEDEQRYFRGREAEKAELVRLIRQSAFVCLYGKSGLGKSSLLKAGVFPALRAARFFPVYLRLDYTEGAAPPLEQALTQLRLAVARERVDAPAPAAGESLWAYLQRRERPLWTPDNFPLTPVLVFDQFEEVFSRGGTASHVRVVLDEIADLVGNRLSSELAEKSDTLLRLNLQSPQYCVVLSFRSDFLAEVASWQKDARLPKADELHLEALTRDVAVTAVADAGEAVLAPGVAAQIVDFVLGRDVGGGVATKVEPVLLSLCCYQLNGRRQRPAPIDAELLRNVGQDILLDFYNEALAGSEPHVSVFIEDHLILGQRYRNSYPRDEAINGHLITEPELQRLVESKLVRVDPQGDVPRIELIHDRLVGIVRDAREARLAREQAELTKIETTKRLERERDAERFEHAQRERTAAKREARRVGRWRNGLAAAFVLLVLLTVGLWHQRDLTANALHRAQGYLLAARGESILAGTSEGSDTQAYQQLLASRSLLAGGESSGALFGALTERRHLRGFDPVVFDEGAAVVGLAVSPDGRWLAVGRRDGKVSMRDLSDLVGTTVATPGPIPPPPGSTVQGHGKTPDSSYIRSLVFSSDGTRLFSGSGDGTLRRWTTAPLAVQGEPRRGHVGPVFSVALSADGKQIASGGEDGTVRLWDADTDAPSQEVPIPAAHGRVFAVAYNPRDPSELFVATGARKDGTSRLLVIDLTKNKVKTDAEGDERIYYAHFGEALSLAFSAQGHWIASGGSDDTVRVRDLTRKSEDSRSSQRLSGHGGDVWIVAFSPDSRRVASAGADKVVRLWRTGSDQPLGLPLVGHIDGVPALAFTPDGRWLISGSLDRTVRLWPMQPAWKPGTREWVSPPARVRMSAVARDGHLVAMALDKGKVLLRDDEKDAMAEDASLDASFEPTSEPGLTRCRPKAGGEGPTAGARSPAAPENKPAVCVPTAMALRSDGSQLVTVYADGSLRRWDTATAQQIGAPLQVGQQSLMSAAWSGDGRHLAVLDEGGAIMVLTLNANGELAGTADSQVPVAGPQSGASVIALDAEGVRIAVAGADQGKPWLRLLEPGQPSGASFSGVFEQSGALAFGSRGDQLFSGSKSGNVRVWDVPGRQPITKPTRAHAGALESIALTRDGRSFVSVDADGLPRAWPAEPHNWTQLMCEKLARNPSRRTWRSPGFGLESLPYRCVCPGLPIEPDDPPPTRTSPSKPERCSQSG